MKKYSTPFKSFRLHNNKVYMICDKMEGDLILRKYFSMGMEGLEDSTHSQEGNGYKFDDTIGFLVKNYMRVAPSDPISDEISHLDVPDEINKEIISDYDVNNYYATTPNNPGDTQFQSPNVVDAIQ